MSASYSAGTTPPDTTPASQRTPAPPGSAKCTMRPGDGAKPRGILRAIRAPRSRDRVPADPAAGTSAARPPRCGSAEPPGPRRTRARSRDARPVACSSRGSEAVPRRGNSTLPAPSYAADCAARPAESVQAPAGLPGRDSVPAPPRSPSGSAAAASTRARIRARRCRAGLRAPAPRRAAPARSRARDRRADRRSWRLCLARRRRSASGSCPPPRRRAHAASAAPPAALTSTGKPILAPSSGSVAGSRRDRCRARWGCRDVPSSAARRRACRHGLHRLGRRTD